MWRRLQQHWFLFGLGFVFAVGFGGGGRLSWLLEASALRSGFVFSVMWLTGVTLRADAIGRSFTQPGAAVLATLLNVVAVPALCWSAWWILPPKIGAGLYVAGLVPCTLASAAIWTRRAGGDDSVALLTTLATNLGCVFVVPVGLWIGMGQTSDIPISDQIGKLMLIIVAPLLFAQICRRLGLASWADRHKPRLSQVAQSGILVMVFFGAIASRNLVPDQVGGSVLAIGAFGILVLLMCCVLVHLGVLWAGIRVGRAWRMGRDRQIAVGFSASQKTLMVGLQIAIDCGVSVVPMIVYHLTQLLIDTYVAERWKQGPPDRGGA